jgi:hypothetical protein
MCDAITGITGPAHRSGRSSVVSARVTDVNVPSRGHTTSSCISVIKQLRTRSTFAVEMQEKRRGRDHRRRMRSSW